MKTTLFSLVAIAVATATATATVAQAAPTVEAAWSRPAAKGTTGVGFMVLSNPGAKPDALIAVQSIGARQVEIHQSRVNNGVASMRPVASVSFPVGGRVTFAPGGYHLMFLGLAKAQKVGDRLPAVLIFASGVRTRVSFIVGLAPSAAGHDHHP